MIKRICALLCFWILLAAPPKAHAQGCSICTKTTAGLGNDAANGFNKGILYLAFLPLSIMGTLGYIWYKRNFSDK